MLLVNLFNLLRGYVVIFVEGYFLERFINICTRRNIYLWDLKKLSQTTLRAKISIKGFRLLPEIARKSKVHIHILSKRGMPFVIHRYRKRYAVIVGLVIFFIVFWILTSFVWMIDISGNEQISREDILSALENNGVKIGTYTNSIDVDQVQNGMKIELDKLSWAGIEKRGSKVIVEIRERKSAPMIYDKTTPVNIIAKKDGIIKNILATDGAPVVKIGDTVQKGDLLISGIITGETEGNRKVHSYGEVVARTFYEKRAEVPLSVENKVYTGNEVSRKSIKIFNFKINLYRNSGISYSNYDKIEEIHELTVGKLILPITYIKEIYKEYTPEIEPIDEEQAINQFVLEYEQELFPTLEEGYEILDKKIEHTPGENNTIHVRAYYECAEKIGVEEAITVEEAN